MENKVSFTMSLLCTLVLVFCCHKLLLVTARDTTTCRPPKCCNGNQNCAECKPGYYGHICTFPCRFPNYGVNCQEMCECEQQQCDHTTGCKNIQTSDNAEVLLSGHVTKPFLQNESHTKQLPQTTKSLLISTRTAVEFPMSTVERAYSLDKETTNPLYGSKHPKQVFTLNVKTNEVALLWNVTNVRNESKVNETSNKVTEDEYNIFQWTCMSSRKTAMLICFSVFGTLLLVIICISVKVISKQNV